MARQESEGCAVPEAPGNRSGTWTACRSGGGKAAPVEGEGRQLRLSFATAEDPWSGGRGAKRRRGGDRSPQSMRGVPKAKGKPKRVGPARMEEVVERLDDCPPPHPAWNPSWDSVATRL